MTNRLVSAAKGIWRAIAETYRLGGKAWRAAPLLVAIAVVPEFLQHIVEIKLGMFESLRAFRDLANHPTRWLFGYAKVAGMLIAILTVARFWAVGSLHKTFLIPPRDLARLAFAIALAVVASLPFNWAEKQGWPAAVGVGLQVVSFLLQAGLTLYVAAALFGDRTLTLRTAFTERWPTALVLTVAALCAFVPGQILHMANHKLALGQPAAVVWALMTWDALVVGLIASLTGSALWAGYRSGATWRGWETAPEPGEIAAPVATPAETPAAPPEPPTRRRPRSASRRRR